MAIISKVLDPGTDAPPLAGFALAWRWQPDGRHPLPPSTLARMQVLAPAQARAAFRISDALLRSRGARQGLDGTRFALTQCDAAVLEGVQVAAWLQRCAPAGRTRVWLSWEPELALCTRWDVFVLHWQAFCYPGSDDVVVFPASLRWALFHSHAQHMAFGRVPAAPGDASIRKASGPLQHARRPGAG